MNRSEGAPRDHRVILLIVALAVTVLLVSVVSALIPGIDWALATLPIVVLVLVVGTVIVLFGVLRR